MILEMQRAWVGLGLALCLAAQERWVEVRSGPFQVLSAAGERPAQETLGRLEQFRYAFGRVLSREDLRSVWPIRVLIFRAGRRAEAPSPPALARDSFMACLTAETAPRPEWLRACARILLEANARRLPAEIESGLLDYYSMVSIAGARITVGQAPPNPGVNWARIHLLSLHPDYYGKLRPLLHNLQQGTDPEPAWRNAVGKHPEEIQKQAAAYLAAGNFTSETFSGRPLNPRTDFRPEALEPPAGELAQADLRLAQGRLPEARNLYRALLETHPGLPEAEEGLGLAALAAGATEDGRRHLAAALQAGSRNARACLEAARLEPEAAKALPLLRKAAELNPEWAEPHRALAQRETDPARRLQALALAAKLAPRDASLWRELALAQEQAEDFRAAARSWAAAEQAAEEAERAEIRQARRSIEQRRSEAEAAARRREAEQRERELDRLKEEALARIRAAEARANRESGPPPARVEPWFETPQPQGKIRGRLRQIDCLRGAARLIVQSDDGTVTRLAIRDPSQVVVLGGGRLELPCGPQKQPRAVTIEYFPRPDAKLGTAGEVAAIEYR